MQTPLCELALRFGTDKAGSHEYTQYYWELFKDRRDEVKKVLEIGIGSVQTMWKGYQPGASLRMWEAFFPNAMVYGCDINVGVLFNEGRIRTCFCNQSTVKSLQDMVGLLGDEFDLILDDGSHVPAHQITSMQVLLPALAPNGLYIIEDLVGITSDVITSKIPAGFTFEVHVCPSRRGQEEVVVIRRA